MSIPIGIDLGTTYSCVSAWDHQTESIQVITNQVGDRTTPSVIAWIDNQTYIGQEAKSWFQEAPKSILWEVKRFIGRDFQEDSVQNDIKQVSYIVSNHNNSIQLSPRIFNSDNASYQETIHISPIEASSMILSYLKKNAEEYLGQNVTDAVITVPAYFGEPQREATKLAGELAGLNVIRVIPEPTAAALAYYQSEMNQQQQMKNILVFDWGGGTLDVSILTLEEGIVEVVSISGDHHLGGEDIDHILIERIWNEWIKRLQIDYEKEEDKPQLDEIEKSKLRIVVEKIKRMLSSTRKVKVDWDPYPALLDYYQSINKLPSQEQRLETKKPFWISRETFEEWVEGIIHRALKPVDDAIHNCKNKLQENKIQEIILVGGSTRIPAIQEALRRRFPNSVVHQKINPDECVAIGAGVQAALLSGITHKNLADVLLLDVLPFSVGIETVGGVMTKLIERNTTLPAYATQTFTTNEEDQESVEVLIYQGERAFVADNILLGRFELNGIPPAMRGQPRIVVTFTVDANGILHVEAQEKITGQKCGIQVQTNHNVTDKEKQKIIEEAQSNLKQDEERRLQVETYNDIHHWLYRIKDAIKKSQFHDHQEVRNTIQQWECTLEIIKNKPVNELKEEWEGWKKITQEWLNFLSKS